jgi:hypothetical protein
MHSLPVLLVLYALTATAFLLRLERRTGALRDALKRLAARPSAEACVIALFALSASHVLPAKPVA